MPELSRFFGVIIRMYAEVGGPHHLPHFHAYYEDDVAVVGLDPVELIAGSLPRRQRRFVEAWAELHQKELMEDWERLQAGHRYRSHHWSEAVCGTQYIAFARFGLWRH
jgi:hypothetical protein